MGFNNVAQLATSQAESGKFWQQHIFKTTQPTAVAGTWVDCSVGAGIPIYNPYIGNTGVFTPLTGASNNSIYLGPDTGDSKFVAAVQLGTSAASIPNYFLFCDYLGFYPLVNLDDVATQTFNNTQTLPRYTNGVGVQAFLVMQTPGSGLNTSCTMTYTNSAGVSGRTVTFGVFSAVNIGSVANQVTSIAAATSVGPMIPLATGDTGIRSIQDITMTVGVGAFANIVLCKVLFGVQMLEQNTVVEKVFFKESGTLPELQNGAFLQFLALRGSATALQPLRGYIDITWS